MVTDKGGYVGYVVLIHETLHEGMQSFPTTLYGGGGGGTRAELAAVPEPEDRRRPTVTPTGISQHFGRCEMGSNFVIMLI